MAPPPSEWHRDELSEILAAAMRLHAGARRLNRRLRNARATLRELEDGLAALLVRLRALAADDEGA